MMKRLDYLNITSFLTLFGVCIAVLLFVLIIDSLAMHVSSLIEKGVSGAVMIKLISFILIKVIAVAIPLATLAASIIYFNGLTERHELMAAHAAGISTLKLSRPLLGVGLVLMMAIGYYSFYIVPQVNLHIRAIMFTSLYESPSAAIRPGYFSSDIEGYTMRVARKSQEKNMLYDVYISEEDTISTSIILADSGKLVQHPLDGTMFILYHGSRYEELDPSEDEKGSSGFGRTYFDSMYVNIRSSTEASEKLKLNQYRHFTTSTRPELIHAIDSLKRRSVHIRGQLKESNMSPADSTLISGLKAELAEVDRLIPRYRYEFAAMHSLAVSVGIFLLLGIGLGTSVRGRGTGIGRPALIAFFCFVLFYLLKTNGDRLARKGVLNVWMAAFLPTLVFGPVALISFLSPYLPSFVRKIFRL